MEMDKVRRGPQVKMFGNEKCQICERKADGYHYNVLSCQGEREAPGPARFV